MRRVSKFSHWLNGRHSDVYWFTYEWTYMQCYRFLMIRFWLYATYCTRGCSFKSTIWLWEIFVCFGIICRVYTVLTIWYSLYRIAHFSSHSIPFSSSLNKETYALCGMPVCDGCTKLKWWYNPYLYEIPSWDSSLTII